MKLRSRFLPVAAAAALALAACDADEDVAEPGVEDTETGADTGATAEPDEADDAVEAVSLAAAAGRYPEFVEELRSRLG